MILYAKYGEHQPLNRQSETYAREGVDLDVSTPAFVRAGFWLIMSARAPLS
jgi:Transposase IS66 family